MSAQGSSYRLSTTALAGGGGAAAAGSRAFAAGREGGTALGVLKSAKGSSLRCGMFRSAGEDDDAGWC